MAAKQRILITGASGLLGRALMNEFTQYSAWEVLGLAYSRVHGNLKKANLLDFDEMSKLVIDFKPHLLIHAAAERRPDVVENDPSVTEKLNIGTTQFLAKTIESLNYGLSKPEHFMVYISTDYVFDGNAAPYKPNDAPNPLNKYGESKLEGEKAVQKEHKNGIILRVPVLYGDVESLDESAVTVLLKVLKQKEETVIDDYLIRYPTLVDDVAGICHSLCEEKLKNGSSLSGIFHWSGNQAMTKFQMICLMAELFKLPMSHVKGNKNAPSGPTRRPFNTALHCGKMEDLLGEKVSLFQTPLREGLKRYLVKHI
ncbi:methionine adenosyltransferase 2 subunit beta [Nematostella vectensis]|uniref:methionine adenosyltransferase 2 subunit beta n=1 Tax=Nematostella vectensis TaxID=45351 RepID=UPI00138FCE93|nr:methionine adenosyltransferase 2 subunit beta [Nematostella vectensis]